MSFDEIAHLDWNPDTGLGLRERALGAWEEKQLRRTEELEKQVADLLTHAAGRISEVLGILNAENCRVEPKNKDGDGTVFFNADGMEFKVNIVYPNGGGDEPSTLTVSVMCRSGWLSIRDVEGLGEKLDGGLVKMIERDDEVPESA